MTEFGTGSVVVIRCVPPALFKANLYPQVHNLLKSKALGMIMK
jgi:hypothetical protein